MIKKLFTLITAITVSLVAFSQDVKVSGTITDGNGNTIPGAIIVEKGTANVVKSGSDGTYSITVPNTRIPATVMIRFTGAGSSEVSVDGTSSEVSFSPSLGAQTKSLNEVVISASKKSEKILNAPASVSVISEARIQQNTSLSVVDNLRKTAAVDIMPTGLVSNNVNVRGFNGIFSGSLLYLVDNRVASVPSLRVNAFQLVPTANTDITSMEVVRGPASALYGPFAANGVLAIYTKSPIDMENRMEISMGLTSGLRAGDDNQTIRNTDGSTYNFTANNSVENLGILNPEMRIAARISKQLGVKVSGNYISGSDFAFFDPREPNGKSFNMGNQAGGNAWASDGSASQTFARDFRIKKYSLDARVDFRPADGTEFVFSGGYSNNTNMELTGLGAAQAKDWVSNYFQTRFKQGRFFAQYFINQTNSGNTNLIPQSATQDKFTFLKENSNLQSLQLQHSADLLSKKLGLIYGFDAFLTRPSGNVYGRFDKKANINQYGGYLQANYKLSKQWSVTAASRLDYQDVIDEWMLSPRAALVYKPKENHTFRATYNRAFTSPSALNFFLDVNNSAYRAFGNSTGLDYRQDVNGIPQYLTSKGNWESISQASVAASAQNSLQNTLTALLTKAYIGSGFNPTNAAAAAAGAAASVTPGILNGVASKTAPTVVDLNIFGNEYSTQLSSGVAQPTAYASSLAKATVDAKSIQDKEAVKSTVTQTAEIGYKGFLMDKLSVGVDLYYTRINNFVSPLTSGSYQVLALTGPAAQAQLAANIAALKTASPSAALLFSTLDAGGNKNGTALDEIIGLYSSPQYSSGTVAPQNTISGSDIILTYLNLGTVDVAGADFSFNYAATKQLSIDGAFSFVNKDKIPLLGAAGGYVGLNAPKYKSALGIDYKLPIDKNNVSARLGWRWMDQFYANSAVYIGQVDPMNMFDLGLSWKPSNSPNTTLSLNVNNVLDYRHQFFPGTPAMGRVALFKILHTFGVK